MTRVVRVQLWLLHEFTHGFSKEDRAKSVLCVEGNGHGKRGKGVAVHKTLVVCFHLHIIVPDCGSSTVCMCACVCAGVHACMHA